jgi:hypothetical protein
MSPDAVFLLKYGFDFLRILRDEGDESFVRAMGRLGCQPRSMSLMARVCLKWGVIVAAASGRGYHLTNLGCEVLRHWEEVKALGGEPSPEAVEARRAKPKVVAAFHSTPDEPIPYRMPTEPPPVGVRITELDADAAPPDDFGL